MRIAKRYLTLSEFILKRKAYGGGNFHIVADRVYLSTRVDKNTGTPVLMPEDLVAEIRDDVTGIIIYKSSHEELFRRIAEDYEAYKPDAEVSLYITVEP